jgi:hypothetical protein
MSKTFSETAIKFVADGSALNKGLADIQKAVGDAAGRMATLTSHAMLAVGAGLAAGAAGLAVLVKQSADVGDDLIKLSQRVAISVETLSGYGLATKLADMSLEDFGTSLQRASRNIVDASQGTGIAADAFDALGIRVKDGSGNLKSAEQIMLEVADRFQGMEDGARKTAFAMDIFGRSGASMIPLLNQGAAAIAAQRTEAKDLGSTWTTAQAEIADGFNSNLKRIGSGLEGFRNAVAGYLMPFADEVLTSILAKIKEWSASGDLKRWALTTAEVLIGAFVRATEAVAAIASAAPLVVDGFRSIMVGVKILETGFAAAIGSMMRGIEGLAGGLAWWAELWGDPWAVGLRKLEGQMKGLADTFTLASQQSADSAVGWSDAIGSNNAAAEKFSGTLKGMTGTFRDWAAKAIMAGSLAAAGTEQAAKKLGEATALSAKEMVKALDDAYKALKTGGETSLHDEMAYLTKRAKLFRDGTAERIQADAEAFKFAQGMTDRIFAHQQSMGLKSLQDEIDFQRQKAAAAKSGSDARMKAEEDVYKKEEDLRNKRNSAALGILGEVKDRLEAQGYGSGYVTKADVERVTFDIQAERARKAAEAQRFAGGGGMSIDAAIAAYTAVGQLNAGNAQQGALGSPGAILAGGAGVGKGPLTESLGGLGWSLENGMSGSLMRILTDFDVFGETLLGKANLIGSKVSQAFYDNMEAWFVRRLMNQAERG